MFFTKKRNSLKFYQKWYLPIISAITNDGKKSYGSDEVEAILIVRVEKIEFYLQSEHLKEWNLSDKIEKQKLLEQIKNELLNPKLL